MADSIQSCWLASPSANCGTRLAHGVVLPGHWSHTIPGNQSGSYRAYKRSLTIRYDLTHKGELPNVNTHNRVRSRFYSTGTLDTVSPGRA